MATQAQVKSNGQTAGGAVLYAQADLEKGAIVWSLDDKNPPKHKCKIKLDFPKHAGPQPITVNLIDTTGQGLQFSSDPLWVNEGGPCPKQSGINTVQIENVVPNGSVLTFTDLNVGKECTLIYQLNFVDRDKNPVEPLDPEIKNGGTNIASPNLLVLALIGACVAAVAYVAIRASS